MTVDERPASVFDPDIRSLPAGYTGLPRQLVDASQRQRLLHAVVATVAETGFGAATVADIASRAGVSKKTFYAHFPDRLACFLAAYEHGRTAMLEAVTTAGAAALSEGAPPIEQLRRSTRAFLEFVAREAPFMRTFYLDIPAAGETALEHYQGCRDAFTQALRAWHDAARTTHPEWPAAPPLAYEAATGAVNAIVFTRIAQHATDQLASLEEELVDVQLAILRVQHERLSPSTSARARGAGRTSACR